MNPEELKIKQQRTVYFGNGMSIMADFLRSALAAGLRLSDAQAAFELGCGGARLIRHLRSIEGLRLVGSDLLEENIKWCRENLSGIEFYANQLKPPLKFADDESFDFVFAFSVFTHIPIPLQLPWIQEIARILKPGGVAVVTVSSFDKAKTQMNEEEFAQFRNDGTFTMDPDHPRVSFSSASIGSWDVFMTPDYIRELYSQALEVVDQGSGGQAMVTLRKPARKALN
jgi:SAM-dependent methyltransferase